MSESDGPKSSRREISNAFKRARLRFPKNFGLNVDQKNKSEDTEVLK